MKKCPKCNSKIIFPVNETKDGFKILERCEKCGYWQGATTLKEENEHFLRNSRDIIEYDIERFF